MAKLNVQIEDGAFAHQITGAAFLAERKGALLADTMGLGKTRSAIMAADNVGAENILVLCPASVQTNWIREFNRWSNADRPFYVANGRDATINRHGIIIVGYQLAIEKRIRQQILANKWDVLISDEAHYLKEPTSSRTQAMYGPICDGNQGFSSVSEHVWLLSGTPTPNHPGELWVHLRNLFMSGIEIGGKPRGYSEFLNHYTVLKSGKYSDKIVAGKNFDELREKIAPFYLRRMRGDVDLPPITVGEVVLESGDLLADIRALEAGPAGDLIRSILSEDNPFDEFMEFVELSTLRRFVGLAKVKPVLELVRSEMPGHSEKMVIFAYHRDVIKALELELRKDFGVVTITGDTPVSWRQHTVDLFQEDPNVRLFIGQINAAGEGINLFAGNHVLLVEQSWVPGHNAQAIKRVHRTGQTSPVTARFVSLAGTLDEAVAATLRRKTMIVDAMYAQTERNPNGS